MWKNKKADQPLWETTIFIILNLIFFAALLFFVFRSSSGDAIIQEKYAKIIGLTIDGMKPNSEVWINLQLLYEQSDKNNFKQENVVNFDLVNHVVNVRVNSGEGYSFHYFSNLVKIEKTNGGNTLVVKT